MNSSSGYYLQIKKSITRTPTHIINTKKYKVRDRKYKNSVLNTIAFDNCVKVQ